MGLNKSLWLGFISTLSLAACAPQSSNTAGSQIESSSTGDSAIIAGTVVSAQDSLSKSIVGIYSSPDGKGGVAVCTGSLLPGNLVLTAAHCVDRFMSIVFTTDMGAAQKGQMLPVDKVLISPYWSSRQNADKDHGDIALLRFRGTAPAGFVPAAFLQDASALQNGTSILVAGFGVNKVTQSSIDVNKYPDLIGAIQSGKVICADNMKLTGCSEVNMTGAELLRQTTVTISDAKFGMSEILLDQTKGTGACHGDSGGPAYVAVNGKLYLWGVTSRGERDPKNDCSQYSVYTNALAYKGWLNSAAKQLTSTPANPVTLASAK